MTTPWADSLAKRTREDQDLFTPQDTPLKRPDRSPKPSPIKLGSPIPTPTPKPIAPTPEPTSTPFMDRLLKKAGATALDFIASQGDQTVNALGNFSEFALGSRDPRDIPGNVPGQAVDVFNEALNLINSSEEVLKTYLDPKAVTLAGEVVDFGTANASFIGDARRAVGIEGPNFGNFSRRLEENRIASEASQGVLAELVQGKMNLREAELALADIFESRPVTTQIATSPLDVFAVPGAVRGAARGIRGARVLAREAPEIASNLRSLVKPEIAQAAGREPFEQVLEALLKARNHGEARRIIADADPSNFPALREAIDTMDPKLAAVHRAKVVLDMQLTPAEQDRAARDALGQVMGRRRRDPSQPQPPSDIAPGGLQRGFESVSDDFTPEGQSKLFDVETAPSPAPLIDPAELSIQAAERARLAEEAAAGQQGLGLETPIEDIGLPTGFLPRVDDAPAAAAPSPAAVPEPGEGRYIQQEEAAIIRGQQQIDKMKAEVARFFGPNPEANPNPSIRTSFSNRQMEIRWAEEALQRRSNELQLLRAEEAAPAPAARVPEAAAQDEFPDEIDEIEAGLFTDPVQIRQTMVREHLAEWGIELQRMPSSQSAPLRNAVREQMDALGGIDEIELDQLIEITERVKSGDLFPPGRPDIAASQAASKADELAMPTADIKARDDIDNLELGDITDATKTINPVRIKLIAEGYAPGFKARELYQIFSVEGDPSSFVVRRGGGIGQFGNRSLADSTIEHIRQADNNEFRSIEEVVTPQRTRKPRKKLPARAEAELKGYLGEQEYNRRFNLGEFHGERVGKDSGVPMGLRQAQEEVLNLSQQQTTGTGTPQPFLDRPGTGQLFQGDTDAARGIEAVPGELPTPGIVPKIGDKQSVGPRSSMTTVNAIETVDPNVRYELYLADEGQPDHMIRMVDGDTGKAVSSTTYPVNEWPIERVSGKYWEEVRIARRQEITPTAAARGIAPADELSEALEARKIEEEGLSTVELAELRVEEAVALNIAIDTSQKIWRPPKTAGFAGFNREMLIEIARQEGLDPFKPDWWDGLDQVLIRSFRKERPASTAKSRLRKTQNLAERNAREELEQAHVDTGKSHDAAVQAAAKPKPSKKLKTPVKQPTVTSLLPQDLRGSKPRYIDQQIEFEDDLDKALYIVAATKPSKGEPKFLKWINEVTGLDTVQAKAQGKLIRAEIKKLYTGDQETPIFLKSTVTRPKIKPPVPTPIPNQTAVKIGDSITMNGIDSFLSDSRSIDGSRYEMFTPVDVEDTRAFIRVVNEDTGEIITENATETIDEVMTQWEEMMDLAHKPGAGAADVPPTQTGAAGTTPPPEGPPPVNAAGEPFDGDMVERVLTWFKNFLADPARAEEWSLTLEWRRRALQGRIMTAREHMGQLIAGGMDEGEAARRVRADLSGEFPRPQTGPVGLHEIAGPEIRAALENKIAQSLDTILEDDFLEMQATLKALDNALQGKAIPDIRGNLGRSAKTRLQRVFGDEIVEGLDTPQDLETIIATRQESRARRSARSQEDLAPGEFPPDRPFPYPEETALSPIQRPLDPELPGGVSIAESDTRSAFEKARDLQEFGLILRKQYQSVRPRFSHSPGEIPPETWIQQWELMPDPDRHLLMRAAKLAGLTLIDFGNFLKANLASVDFSFWRQQQPLIFGNLNAFASANVEAFKSIWSANYAKKVMDDIEASPWMAFYDEMEIDFLRPLEQKPGIRMVGKFDPKFQGADVDLPGVTSSVSSSPGRQRIVGGVEEFGLFGRERPIQRLTAALPWVQISGRAHITGTNAMNWKIFTTFMEQQRKVERGIAEGTILLKRGETFDIKREAKLFGAMLEDMSGRAQLPAALTKLTPAMNAGFFSMRLNIGRLIMGRHLFSKSPAVRKAAMKNLVTSVVAFSGIILGGKQLGLWDVELNPQSSDFMVIRLGKIRIDPWGGARQFVTFFARILPIAAALETVNIPSGPIPAAGSKSTTTGQINQNFGTLTRMFRSKAAPLASLVIDTSQGENFLGDPVDNTDIMQWAERIAPLAVQDMYEAFQEQGGWSAAAAASAIVGAGVLVYDLPRWPELDEYYNIQANKFMSTSAQRKLYRKKNPLQDARLFVRGQVTTVQTNRARNLVLDIMSEHGVKSKDVNGYEKMFKDKPVPEGRSVSQQEKDRLQDSLDRAAGREVTTRNVVAPKVVVPQVGIKEIFDSFPFMGAADIMEGMGNVWRGGTLTDRQEGLLQTVFEQYPLGQTNFNTWLKQTLRQTFDAGRDTLK